MCSTSYTEVVHQEFIAAKIVHIFELQDIYKEK